MFGKKAEPKKEFDPVEVRMKFKGAINRIQTGINKYDQLIQEELVQYRALKKAHKDEEANRCLVNASRYDAAKRENLVFRDNLKAVSVKVEDMYNRVEASKVMSEAFGAIGQIVDSKELNGIMKDLKSFDQNFSKEKAKLNLFEDKVNDAMASISGSTADAAISPSILNMANSMMAEEGSMDSEEGVNDNLDLGFLG